VDSLTVHATNPSVSRRGRDIPWAQVVRFHRAIVARSEEGFFSLNARDHASERWSSLHDFDPFTTAGPWQLSVDALRSRQFRLAADQGQLESVYLGGPCYLSWTRPGRDAAWVPAWRPVFYREVRLLHDGERISILPAQGKWSLSPLVTLLLERREVTADTPLDDLGAAILEDAASGDDSVPLAERVLDALFRKVPELESVLSETPSPDDFKVQPSPWVLFAPTASFSALTRHLNRDYVNLERSLEEPDPPLGGLRLLNDETPEGHSPVGEVLPFVPLNRSQRSAVEAILYGHPLTVISGPPGTGKSQVVVATLLNAWAMGRTVLFASNNNKAVDVVRDRVERFESEFPLAVRAGARDRQNIQEVLRRTLNILSAARNAGASPVVVPEAKRNELLKTKQELSNGLGTGLPQRIDEALRAALKGYAEHCATHAQIADQEIILKSELHALGLGKNVPAEVAAVASATRIWLESIEDFRQLDAESVKQRAELGEQLAESERRRNEAAEGVGLDCAQAGDWRWLLSGPSPELVQDWEVRFRECLTRPLEELLDAPDWQPSFDRWNSADEASRWETEARAMGAMLRERIALLLPQFSRVRDAGRVLADARVRLKGAGLNEDIQLAELQVSQWLASYAEFATTARTRLDFLPWSRASTIDRRLGVAEKAIRTVLPLEVLRNIGTLDAEGRHKLAPVLEILRDYLRARVAWEATEEVRATLEENLRDIRALSARLNLDQLPDDTNPEHWRPVAQHCDELAELAHHASEAWRRRSMKEEAESELRRLARAWSALAAGLPIREAWRLGQGLEFDRAILALADVPDARSLARARMALYSGSLPLLLEAWRTAREQEALASHLRTKIHAVPTLTARIRAWRAARPPGACVNVPVGEAVWPSLEDAHARLVLVEDWVRRWLEFEEKGRPDAEAHARRQLEWAVDRLAHALSILPRGPDADGARQLSAVVLEAPEAEWPTSELGACFAAFSPERLRARLERVEADLERIAFAEAKQHWLRRLEKDPDAAKAIDALEKAVRRRNDLDPGHYADFRSSLRAVPIWITTAQAAQTIPLEPELFDLVIIDEASQCTLTNLLPLLYRGRRLAVIGDEQQLRAIPTVRATEEAELARRFGVEEWMGLLGHAENDVYRVACESLPRRRADVLNLTEHFRSHPQIIGFCNRHVYQQRLELRKNPDWHRRLPVGSGVHSIQVNGSAKQGDRGQSWVNRQEAERVLGLVAELREATGKSASIGIVTPFAAQKALYRNRLDSMALSSEVLADTANGFQGDERDIIIFSPVVARGITSSACRWVESPPNLVNVALSRAREALFVVGDLGFCAQQEGILRKLAVYCRDIQLLRDTSPAELELFSWMVVKGWAPKVHPRIGDIETDFVLESPAGTRIAIEVDGREFHEARGAQDLARDAFLQAQGFDVMRITAKEVLETPFEVVSRIEERMCDGG
jgi:hypothetical protein